MTRLWIKYNKVIISLITGLIATTTMSSCSVNVPVDATLKYDPVFEKIPLTIGLYESPEFKAYEPIARDESDGDFKFSIGAASSALLQQVLSSMFVSIVPVTKHSGKYVIKNSVAGFIEVEAISLHLEEVHLLKIDRTLVTISYRFSLKDVNGREIKEWTVYGYGNSDTYTLRYAEISLTPFKSDAAKWAIRNAHGQFMREFANSPEVRQWLIKHNINTDENQVHWR